MVSEKKKQTVKEVGGQIEKYQVIGMLDMFKLPGKQLHEIREKLRGQAVIRMVKKRLIKLILKESRLQGIERLGDYIQGEPAMLLSNTDPFKLARIISESKSSAIAKPGDTAPRDIEVRAGPTSLSAGPVIGELQRARIPAGVEGEKIVIKQDVVVAKKGDVIGKVLADILAKLGVEPMEIGLNLLAAHYGDTIYSKEILFVPKEKYINDLMLAHSHALNLTLNINHPTRDNIGLLLSKAQQEATNLAAEASIVTKDTIGSLLSKAGAEARSLEKHIKEQ
jgi:large subunit ribosomal protein L10